MHIAEGIITGPQAAGYTLAGAALLALGARSMKKFGLCNPENKPLLGMGGAFIFFLSLIPIPSFTGTCSHPCGSPLIAILLGPGIGIGLTGLSLLLQAAFFAHGGFSTWGANVIALGGGGCLVGWGAFRLGRRLGLPMWMAGFLGGLLGDIMVYVASGWILAGALAGAPAPQYSFSGYLSVIYLAYLPIQGPIALMEMALTGLVLHYVNHQRPEVLAELGVITRRTLPKTTFFVLALLMAAGFSLASPRTLCAAAEQEAAGPLAGMDEAVNESLAAQAGRPAEGPFIDTEAMGDLWNALLLSAGCGCGFILGRYWHLLAAAGRPRGSARKVLLSKDPSRGQPIISE